jgi:Protein of unknown function (DUF1236)
MQQGRKLREVKMQPCRRFAVAAAFLLCSIATASTAATGPFLVASDDLVLTGAQEHLMWQRLVARNASTTAPSGLIAAIGATLPASVALHALPATVTRQIPEMKPYAYATLNKTLLIVNPTDRVIVDVITG